jgi:hypothetical protein
MLADFGNSWSEIEMEVMLADVGAPTVSNIMVMENHLDMDAVERGKMMREMVRDHAVAYNWESGGLPIVDV